MASEVASWDFKCNLSGLIGHPVIVLPQVIVTTDVVTNRLLWQIWLTIIDTEMEFTTVTFADTVTNKG